MDTSLIALLFTHGPFAVLSGVLAWAYWQKDKKVAEQTTMIMSLIQQKIAADVKLEAALQGLKDVILTSKEFRN